MSGASAVRHSENGNNRHAKFNIYLPERSRLARLKSAVGTCQVQRILSRRYPRSETPPNSLVKQKVPGRSNPAGPYGDDALSLRLAFGFTSLQRAITADEAERDNCPVKVGITTVRLPCDRGILTLERTMDESTPNLRARHCRYPDKSRGGKQ